MKKTLIYANEYLVKAERFFIGLLSIVLMGVILAQVLCRYFFKISTPWAEEIGRYSFVALSYIGGGVGIYYSQFISIDIIDVLVRRKAKNPEQILSVLEKIGSAMILIFFAVFGKYYWTYLTMIAKTGQTSAAAHINMLIPLSSVFIGVIFMAVHTATILLTNNDDRLAIRKKMEAKKMQRRTTP